MHFTDICNDFLMSHKRKLWRYIDTGWRTKCHTIDCAHNAFLLL